MALGLELKIQVSQPVCIRDKTVAFEEIVTSKKVQSECQKECPNDCVAIIYDASIDTRMALPREQCQSKEVMDAALSEVRVRSRDCDFKGQPTFETLVRMEQDRKRII